MRENFRPVLNESLSIFSFKKIKIKKKIKLNFLIIKKTAMEANIEKKVTFKHAYYIEVDFSLLGQLINSTQCFLVSL